MVSSPDCSFGPQTKRPQVRCLREPAAQRSHRPVACAHRHEAGPERLASCHGRARARAAPQVVLQATPARHGSGCRRRHCRKETAGKPGGRWLSVRLGFARDLPLLPPGERHCVPGTSALKRVSAISPLAPSTLYTAGLGCDICASSSANARATKSGAPPGGLGTMRRTCAGNNAGSGTRRRRQRGTRAQRQGAAGTEHATAPLSVRVLHGRCR